MSLQGKAGLKWPQPHFPRNTVAHRDVGAASSLVAFFRTMGGSVGVSALGTALGHQVASGTAQGLARLGVKTSGEVGGTSIPDMSSLPGPVREVVETAFADATGHIFLLSAPFAVLALVAILFLREEPLRTTIHRADELEHGPAALIEPTRA